MYGKTGVYGVFKFPQLKNYPRKNIQKFIGSKEGQKISRKNKKGRTMFKGGLGGPRQKQTICEKIEKWGFHAASPPTMGDGRIEKVKRVPSRGHVPLSCHIFEAILF